MTLATKLATGLLILSKYIGCETFIENQTVFSGPLNPENVTPEDVLILKELGWFVNKAHDSWAFLT